jgi:hypothetical protein
MIQSFKYEKLTKKIKLYFEEIEKAILMIENIKAKKIKK